MSQAPEGLGGMMRPKSNPFIPGTCITIQEHMQIIHSFDRKFFQISSILLVLESKPALARPYPEGEVGWDEREENKDNYPSFSWTRSLPPGAQQSGRAISLLFILPAPQCLYNVWSMVVLQMHFWFDYSNCLLAGFPSKCLFAPTLTTQTWVLETLSDLNDDPAQFSSVQSLSHVRLFATPWIAARQASLSITNSQSSLKLTSIKLVMPSSHLILCRPLLLLPPIPPSFRVFSNESTLPMRQPKYWSFSFSIIPSKGHPGLISFRMDWH